MPDQVDLLDTLVSRYLKRFPEERGGLAALIEQITNEDDLNNPKTLPGHITGSGFVLSQDRTEILLIYHKFLQMWLQPGGHWDPGESDPLAAARREVAEETGVRIAEYLAVDEDSELMPFDIEIQEIPDRPQRQMPAHLHHDFHYAFVAAGLEVAKLETEVEQVGWFSFDAPECEHVSPTLVKMRELGFIA
jgi:8-oxo-dGTP pyrophosphatase MutT (NUDIX family)